MSINSITNAIASLVTSLRDLGNGWSERELHEPIIVSVARGIALMPQSAHRDLDPDGAYDDQVAAFVAQSGGSIQVQLENIARAAYDAGFAASSEGVNGDYGLEDADSKVNYAHHRGKWIEGFMERGGFGVPTNEPSVGHNTMLVDGERRLFVRANADESGEMEEPDWAQIKIDQVFLDELAGYRRSMDGVNAFEIRAQGTPWAWRPDRSGEERYGESFDGEYIVCSPHGFHFVAHGERGGSINTREVSFAELERMLAEPHELMVQTDEPNGPRSSVLAELEEHFDNFDDGPSP